MSQAFSISARRRYGLVRVCTAWRVSRASVSRHLRAANQPGPPRRRPGPQGTMADTGLAERIRSLLAESPFHGEGYRKIWARLRHAGLRTSPRRVLRVMRENGLLAHQRTGSPRGPRTHDGTITTERVDPDVG
jgi:putative transposase